MKEERYIISDAAKKLSVEPHVLRYWEEELELHIYRNEMGHRFYTEEDMKQFEGIKYLKEYGFHLRAIKFLLPDIERILSLNKKQLMDLKYELEYKSITPVIAKGPSHTIGSEDRMEQFRIILSNIVTDALLATEKNISKNVTENVSKEMDYMFRQKEEADEERYRTLDETIRNFQQARRESAIALTQSQPPKKKGKLKHLLSRKTIAF